MPAQLYDVVIYNYETMIIESVVGEKMNLNTGFYNAEKRLDTVLPRLNDDYNGGIVKTGKYKKGDILDGKDLE